MVARGGNQSRSAARGNPLTRDSDAPELPSFSIPLGTIRVCSCRREKFAWHDGLARSVGDGHATRQAPAMIGSELRTRRIAVLPVHLAAAGKEAAEEPRQRD